MVNILKIITLLAAGAIAYNGTLADVRDTRNRLYDAGLPEGYNCLAGVQHRYADLLGNELYFYDFTTGSVYGPILVVDMAADSDAGIMEARGLALDSDCKDMVHKAGIVFMATDFNHRDSIRFNVDGGIVARVRTRMRERHRLCGAFVACHWRVEKWVN